MAAAAAAENKNYSSLHRHLLLYWLESNLYISKYNSKFNRDTNTNNIKNININNNRDVKVIVVNWDVLRNSNIINKSINSHVRNNNNSNKNSNSNISNISDSEKPLENPV